MRAPWRPAVAALLLLSLHNVGAEQQEATSVESVSPLDPTPRTRSADDTTAKASSLVSDGKDEASQGDATAPSTPEPAADKHTSAPVPAAIARGGDSRLAERTPVPMESSPKREEDAKAEGSDSEPSKPRTRAPATETPEEALVKAESEPKSDKKTPSPPTSAPDMTESSTNTTDTPKASETTEEPSPPVRTSAPVPAAIARGGDSRLAERTPVPMESSPKREEDAKAEGSDAESTSKPRMRAPATETPEEALVKAESEPKSDKKTSSPPTSAPDMTESSTNTTDTPTPAPETPAPKKSPSEEKPEPTLKPRAPKTETPEASEDKTPTPRTPEMAKGSEEGSEDKKTLAPITHAPPSTKAPRTKTDAPDEEPAAPKSLSPITRAPTEKTDTPVEKPGEKTPAPRTSAPRTTTPEDIPDEKSTGKPEPKSEGKSESEEKTPAPRTSAPRTTTPEDIPDEKSTGKPEPKSEGKSESEEKTPAPSPPRTPVPDDISDEHSGSKLDDSKSEEKTHQGISDGKATPSMEHSEEKTPLPTTAPVAESKAAAPTKAPPVVLLEGTVGYAEAHRLITMRELGYVLFVIAFYVIGKLCVVMEVPFQSVATCGRKDAGGQAASLSGGLQFWLLCCTVVCYVWSLADKVVVIVALKAYEFFEYARDSANEPPPRGGSGSGGAEEEMTSVAVTSGFEGSTPFPERGTAGTRSSSKPLKLETGVKKMRPKKSLGIGSQKKQVRIEDPVDSPSSSRRAAALPLAAQAVGAGWGGGGDDDMDMDDGDDWGETPAPASQAPPQAQPSPPQAKESAGWGDDDDDWGTD